MLCIVCGIRSPADGSVCAPCRDILKSAVTGTVVPASSDPAPRYDKVDALSESPTSPHLATPPGPSGRLEDVGRRYGAGDQLDGRYTIVEEIGVGGMGVVYKALDRNLEKTVALKLMRARAMDAPNIARFRRELALAQHVSHANVCRVHDLGEVDGVLYISMEHVEGQRLDHLIVSMGRLSPRQTVALGRQLCAGLRAIHEQGIIHRDLKPSNVMVNRSGHVFIMDFGLAIKPGRDKVTSTGAVLGTFAYLSPEQARGLEIGPRSDVYAAGLILYEMLTGVAPPGDEVALPLALRDARERCPPPSELAADTPPELDAIVMRCLERDPGKRFATAEELESALVTLQPAVGSSSARSHRWKSTARLWRSADRRTRWGAGLAAAAFVALAALGTRTWLVRRQAEPMVRPVVAVLPLLNLSGDATYDTLGVGIADVLITRLASLRAINVISGSGTLRYLEKQNVRDIARELGAAFVVNGGIQAQGGQLRITLRLLRANDSIEWTGDYVAPISQIFDVQTRMAEGVASAPVLRAGLAADDAARLATPPTRSVEAFKQYGQARALLEARDIKGNVDGAIRLLEGATRADPKFALAHAALGDAYWAKFGETADTSWSSRAAQSILEAVSLDPDTPQIRVSLARVFQGTDRVDQAVDELHRALAQQPNNDEAHRLLGTALAEQDKIDAAVAELHKAIEIRPEYWENHYILGNRLYRAGRYPAAADAFREVIRLRPESERGHRMLGATFHAMGDLPRALDSYQRAQSIAPSAGTYVNIGSLHYVKGEYANAAESYRRAIELKPLEPNFHFNLADAEERLGSGKAAASYKRAAELLNDLLAVKPNDAQARSLLAMCQMNLGDLDAALANAEQAVARARNDPEVLYRRAAVYTSRGRTKDALAALAEAFDAGYSVSSAQTADSLEPLRNNPDFKSVLETARKKQSRND